MKNSHELRAVQIRQLFRRRISTYLPDMPSIRLLDLTNLVARSLAREFFNGLLELFRALRSGLRGAHSLWYGRAGVNPAGLIGREPLQAGRNCSSRVESPALRADLCTRYVCASNGDEGIRQKGAAPPRGKDGKGVGAAQENIRARRGRAAPKERCGPSAGAPRFCGRLASDDDIGLA